jgi:hypothetical protein
MTRQQMLDEMGITDESFRDYLRKYCSFLNSLEPSQRAFHYEHAGQEGVEEVAKSLGPDVTAREIEHLFAECPPVRGIVVMQCCRRPK